MRIIVVGAGKTGSTIIEYLSSEEHDVVVIDTDAKLIEEIINRNDITGIAGNGADYEILTEADAENTDVLISLTASDELNMLCCMLAKKLGTKSVIARIRNPIYTRQMVFMRNEFGINMILDQDYEAAVEISRILRFPSAAKLDVFAKGRIEMAEIKIGEDNPIVGLPLFELNSKFDIKILVCAVQRGENVYIPAGSFVLEAGDKINVTASHAELADFFKKIGVFKKRSRNVMLAGGGGIAYHLAKQLIEAGMTVKIIEQSRARCVELTDSLPKAKIICGDATDHALLAEEGIENADAFVGLLNLDEENIILSMYANTLDVEKVITKVSRINTAELMRMSGLDSIVSPKNTVAARIVRYIRAMGNSGSSGVQTLYKLVGDRVEALEFLVGNDAEKNEGVTDIALKDLKLKPDLLIASIIRGRDVIYPRGTDVIKSGDTVIVVTANDKYLRDLKDIFA